MMRTDWELMVSGKALISEKNSRKKIFVSEKIATKDLISYVDNGWEKSKDFKNPKFVGVVKEKSAQEQFEDAVWVLFANMGFLELNSGKDFSVAYDFHDDELSVPVSVLAIDEETALVVLCRAARTMKEFSFVTEINSFISKMSGLRKEVLKQYPGRKVKFIWATRNYISNRQDLGLLENAGIAYFNETTIEYYSELAKHLGSCARYQLLGYLFANQEIKNMDDRVPAIQGKMGGYTYYSFSIEPEKLLKIGYVLHRSDANASMMPTYQRIIKKKRLQDVRSFINEGGYFPNSIIISIDTKGKGVSFDQAPNRVENTLSKIGILHIPKRYRSAYIIDGQHRLYGYSETCYG